MVADRPPRFDSTPGRTADVYRGTVDDPGGRRGDGRLAAAARQARQRGRGDAALPPLRAPAAGAGEGEVVARPGPPRRRRRDRPVGLRQLLPGGEQWLLRGARGGGTVEALP